jgi:hypothetical protein
MMEEQLKRIHHAHTLEELLSDSKDYIKRFVVSQDVPQNGYYRHLADGVMFADGLIVTFSYINGFVGETKIYRFQRHLEHAYTRDSIHWLDGKPEVTDG